MVIAEGWGVVCDYINGESYNEFPSRSVWLWALLDLHEGLQERTIIYLLWNVFESGK